MRYSHGDTRAEDGFRFWAYRKLHSGRTQEVWCSPETWANNQKLVTKHNRRKAKRAKKDPAFRAQLRAELQAWTADNPERILLYKARERAKLHNLPFNITVDDIVITARCPALGIPLVRNVSKVHDASPTLDRIIPAKGYVKGNIIVVSHLANTVKSNATPAQILKVGAFYKQLEGDMSK